MPKMTWDAVRMHRVRVKGSKGAEYVVTVSGSMPQWCTCPSFEHRNGPAGTFCKHMKSLHGREAIGRTRCASCRSYLTPEDIDASSARGVAEPQIRCPECTPS